VLLSPTSRALFGILRHVIMSSRQTCDKHVLLEMISLLGTKIQSDNLRRPRGNFDKDTTAHHEQCEANRTPSVRLSCARTDFNAQRSITRIMQSEKMGLLVLNVGAIWQIFYD
jgi:hypothetical protein